jgi:tRNA nucleotidyltransferase (CCA-adding enzyme)
MHLIVTHDNADFDAVASLLGAAKLYPDAHPLIPNRLNRNVRDFLHLYWEEFPFVRPHETPKGTVDRLTMVDSQHVPPLPGLNDGTQFHVIDHHALSPNLPADTVITLQDTGATATLMVEEIQRQHIRLTPNQATLMLLGIYEDTGSLLYSSTTTRDVYAAAWLLEQNASLEVVRQFLKYPLSESQRDLYRRMTDHLETHQVEGHIVMISAVQAIGYVEELSTLAHKLRDLFEPDAIFLVVAMDDHIQVVARSTSDAIDVGAITACLGGGGHARAAAALIHHQDFSQVHDRLLDLLNQQVQPSITVDKIMSRGVHTLAPADTVKKASEMMTRYGHEGFPVVAEGQIVGVLTRREIDKALHHQLGGSAIRQFMHKGEFFVTPQDSVDTLQALMTREGLGQVPVVENGKIIGIATRTDLIKLWSEAPRPSRATEISQRLTEALPPPLLHLLREAGRVAAQQGALLFIVGGFVRDLLHNPNLGLEVSYPDIDLVAEGDAIRLARQLAQQYGGQVRSHRRFGTAKWLIDDSHQLANSCPPAASGSPAHDVPLPPALDFVTARTEFYEHPSALPEVERSSIKQDLYRRDFTINTLAIQLSPDHYGDLLDFYGGENDLRQGLIRVLHSLSFVEDPTRMLRAVRLEQRMGFRIEARTAELLDHALDLLDRVSGERIYHELHLIFQDTEPEPALRRLDELGILKQVHPDLCADNWVIRRITAMRTGLNDTPWATTPLTDVHYLGLLTFRLSDRALQQVVVRLRIRAADASVLRQVQTLKSRLPQIQQTLRPSQIYRYLESFTSESLLIGWLGTEDETARAQIGQFQRELRGIDPIIDGHYLRRELDLRPGPIYRRILDDLRAARLDGQVVTLADERAWVERWLEEHGNDDD